jgi:hypothetical protein
LTEKVATKTTEKKVKAPVIKVDEKGEIKPEKKTEVPAAVLALAKELKIDADNLLGWNVYPDRVVLISMNGMKFSRSTNQGK